MNRKIIQPTPFGPVVVMWSRAKGMPKITRIALSQPGRSAENLKVILKSPSRVASCAEIDGVARSIQAFLEGEKVFFSLQTIDLAGCSPFQRAVLRAEHAIPRGQVSTYQLIAKRINRPNSARAVGHALATNPFPLIVPCHRAIRSDRTLGGFQGGLKMKRQLLQNEGIVFDAAGRVSGPRLYYSLTF